MGASLLKQPPTLKPEDPCVIYPEQAEINTFQYHEYFWGQFRSSSTESLHGTSFGGNLSPRQSDEKFDKHLQLRVTIPATEDMMFNHFSKLSSHLVKF